MVDEIPGQNLIGFLPAVDVEIGVYVHLAKRAGPVAAEAMDSQQESSRLPVPEGEQGLDVIPFRQIMRNPDRLLTAQTVLNSPHPPADDGGIFQRMPLKRGRGLRDKLVDPQRQAPETFLP